MGDMSVAVLDLRGSSHLVADANAQLAAVKLPRGVARRERRFSSDDPQALFDCVSYLVDRLYRSGRRAELGGRGELATRVGIALDSSAEDAVMRAMSLMAESEDNTILAEAAVVEQLDRLRCLPFDLSTVRKINNRACHQTFPPDQHDCFVMMPMGDERSEIRMRSERVLEELVRPACRQLRLRPVAPTRQSGESIPSDVFGSLHLASLTVAYLGGPDQFNANVMLEIGYRIALGRPLVLIADGELPFDIRDRRAVMLSADWESTVEDKRKELVNAMSDRLENGSEGGDLYPIAEIEVDERNVPDERKRHRIAAASSTTASLFGLPRDLLVGMSPADLIAHLGEIMGDSNQFGAFQAEQADLYAKLGSLASTPMGGKASNNVTATVPLTFFCHPDPRFNGRAFLPCVIHQSRRPAISSTQRVVYVEVTQAVRRRKYPGYGEVRVCELKEGNGGLAFELYARSYDEILNRLTNYQEVRDRHVNAVVTHCNGSGSNARVLDVGAGTGNVSIPLAAHGLGVWAIDSSQAMLDRLSSKLTGTRHRVHTEHRNCRWLRTYADGSFDAVTMSLVLFATGGRQPAREALAEAMRVLRPGGLLVLTEPRSRFQLAPLLEQAEQELRSLPEWATLSAHWETVMQANSIINPETKDYLPVDEIYEDLSRHQFRNLDMHDAYRGHCATIVGCKGGAPS